MMERIFKNAGRKISKSGFQKNAGMEHVIVELRQGIPGGFVHKARYGNAGNFLQLPDILLGGLVEDAI